MVAFRIVSTVLLGLSYFSGFIKNYALAHWDSNEVRWSLFIKLNIWSILWRSFIIVSIWII